MKMKLLVLSATLAVLAALGFAQPTNIIQDLQQVAKLPREKWAAALQTIINRRGARNPVDDAILAALERLRERMPEGIPELGIPPLDPYYQEHYKLDLTGTGLPEITLVVDKATVTGLSKFIVNSLNSDLDQLKADYDLSVPALHAVGMYNISGNFAGMDLFGNGPFTIDLGKLTAWGTLIGGSEGNSLDGKAFVKSLTVDFELDSMKVNFENLMGGGTTGEMLNQLISEEGPALLQQYKEEVVKLVSDAIIGIANPLLGQYTLREILDYLGIPHP